MLKVLELPTFRPKLSSLNSLRESNSHLKRLDQIGLNVFRESSLCLEHFHRSSTRFLGVKTPTRGKVVTRGGGGGGGRRRFCEKDFDDATKEDTNRFVVKVEYGETETSSHPFFGRLDEDEDEDEEERRRRRDDFDDENKDVNDDALSSSVLIKRATIAKRKLDRILPRDVPRGVVPVQSGERRNACSMRKGIGKVLRRRKKKRENGPAVTRTMEINLHDRGGRDWIARVIYSTATSAVFTTSTYRRRRYLSRV